MAQTTTFINRLELDNVRVRNYEDKVLVGINASAMSGDVFAHESVSIYGTPEQIRAIGEQILAGLDKLAEEDDEPILWVKDID
jgi:hypothetical protein